MKKDILWNPISKKSSLQWCKVRETGAKFFFPDKNLESQCQEFLVADLEVFTRSGCFEAVPWNSYSGRSMGQEDQSKLINNFCMVP